MLLMHGIDINLTNSKGKKAKNVTSSEKILDIIRRHEKNLERASERVNVMEASPIVEEEDELSSSYMESPP